MAHNQRYARAHVSSVGSKHGPRRRPARVHASTLEAEATVVDAAPMGMTQHRAPVNDQQAIGSRGAVGARPQVSLTVVRESPASQGPANEQACDFERLETRRMWAVDWRSVGSPAIAERAGDAGDPAWHADLEWMRRRGRPGQDQAEQAQDQAQPQLEPTVHELPPQKGLLRRIDSRPSMMHYHRLIVLTAAINLVLFVVGLDQGAIWTRFGADLGLVGNLVLGNIALAILIRQQYVVNVLFKVATSVPTSWPLPIRRLAGKVYHFGGLHVGGAVFGTLWFGLFVVAATHHLANGLPGVSFGTVITSYAILSVLLLIVFLSLPSMRERYHDLFERSHRFGGWTALALFWLQTVLFVNDQRGDVALGDALLSAPGFWTLAVVTVSVALPWLRLRKVPVEIVEPSSHVAIARFDYGVTPFAGSSTTLSRNPLMEWHAFANVPSPDADGYRLTISRAGDWTGELIDDMPSHVWVKGIPTAGVGNIDKLFKRVVWIATGSGIGPCLPHLLANEVPARLVWSTRNPRKTYGDELVDEILEAQPGAMIWNTDSQGRPDLVQLAYQAYRDFDAEAVICISNKKLTWKVVSGLESRGIPAYGAIWDS